MNPVVPVLKDIMLLGGGHSHALVIRRWAMNPLPGTRLTLVSQNVLTPYSGMLPGYIAGHYTSENIHIDLSRLCRWANIRFIEATITGLDLASQTVFLDDRPALGYDLLSIDTGSTPETRLISGAAEHAIPVKPINQLQARWQAFTERLDGRNAQIDIGVVGSGVGGFELLLAIDHSLKAREQNFALHWILRGESPIKSRPKRARRLALDACTARGVIVHTGFDVSRVIGAGLESTDGRSLSLDEVFWCTAAAASDWPGKAGLQTDSKGFIATNAFLQSASHANVFASGDIGSQLDTPSEKAGVFAVRQAPVLYQNLRNSVSGLPLKKYTPQKNTLSLMALGNKSAIATRGRITLSGDWVWRWKDRIDQAFMNKFSELPDRSMPTATLRQIPSALRIEANIDLQAAENAMRCGGCGAKIPSSVLGNVMSRLRPVERDDVLVGIHPPDDAAIIRTQGRAMAQSVDQFRAMLDDPWLFGRIAALHALSDLFAMSAEPQSALALVTLPHAADKVLERDLYQLMSGALLELNRHNCALTGGHTGEGAEMSLGFAVNGWMPDDDNAVSPLLQAGDRLILTQAIGTGVLLSADMRAKAKGILMQACLESMLTSNATAAAILGRHCSAMTDVTGFGLLGHLSSLVDRGALDCTVYIDAIPWLPGARELSREGHASTLLPANLRFMQKTKQAETASLELSRMLCDPQTSGGLLAGVPEQNVNHCLAELRAAGYDASQVIGEVSGEEGTGQINLR